MLRNKNKYIHRKGFQFDVEDDNYLEGGEWSVEMLKLFGLVYFDITIDCIR